MLTHKIQTSQWISGRYATRTVLLLGLTLFSCGKIGQPNLSEAPTPEPTPVVSPEPTPEPSPEPAPEEPKPTPEPEEPVPTPEPQPEPTPVPTPMPEPTPQPTPEPTPRPQHPGPVKGDCAMVSSTVSLRGRVQELPATGPFVLESHILSTYDFTQTTYPQSITDGIAEHMTRSCGLLLAQYGAEVVDCNEVYKSKYVRIWTPSEGGGLIGQGSNPKRPSPWEEMWHVNMMWSSPYARPKPGERFLMQANGRSVVVTMGYETGPGDTTRWLGGVQGEMFWWLGIRWVHQTNTWQPITLGKLKDQTLPVGPIECNDSSNDIILP